MVESKIEYANPKERLMELQEIQDEVFKNAKKILKFPAGREFKPGIYTTGKPHQIFIKKLSNRVNEKIYRLLNLQLINERATTFPFTFGVMGDDSILIQEYFQYTFYDVFNQFNVNAKMIRVIFNFIRLIMITLISFRRLRLLHRDLHGGNFMINHTNSTGTNVYNISPDFRVHVPLENMEIVVIDYESAAIYPDWDMDTSRNIIKHYFPIFYLTERDDINLMHNNMHYVDMWLAMRTFQLILSRHLGQYTTELHAYIRSIVPAIEKKIFEISRPSVGDNAEKYTSFCRDVIEQVGLIEMQVRIANLFYLPDSPEQRNFDIISVESIV